MARLPRLSIPGLPHHVLLRGNNGQAVFVDDADRREWLEALSTYGTECGVALHAWVLLPQSVQLLLTPATADSLSRFMQAVGRKYTRQFNLRHGRSGTLWEGRYRSCLVQHALHLLSCMRYIELNPVRAAMVADPGGYRWTSYRANGLGNPDARLTPHPLYLGLDADPVSRRAAYRALFRPQLDAEAASDVREALKLGMPLGSERFAEAICARLGIRRNTGKRHHDQKRGANQ